MAFFGKKTTVPAWASYFTEKEYGAFVNAVDFYFNNAVHLTYEIKDGVVYLQENEFGLQNLGLDNLARTCKQNDRADYREIVESHFNTMKESQKFQREFEQIERNFDAVKQYIAVRLYDRAYIDAVGTDCFIAIEFAGELKKTLVFDFPHTLANIKPEQIKHWGKTHDELFEIGLENTRRNYKFDLEQVEFGQDKEIIYACEAEHLFATNILLDLEQYKELIGKGGSLVAAPNRNIALVYPINDLKVAHMVNDLCAAAYNLYNNPGCLTKEIYWYKDKKFILLPYEIQQKKINFFPPEEFVELLNSLA